MSFQFPLAAVLRYRESLEQREYFALERIQHEVTRVELMIRQVEETCSTAVQNRSAELARGLRAADVQAAYEYQKALEQQREALLVLLQELKMKWRQQLASYELARRNRETLEKLREKQLDTYVREHAKREQAAMDDIFLSRRGRGN
jgi:flagellar export protein FliJ